MNVSLAICLACAVTAVLFGVGAPRARGLASRLAVQPPARWRPGPSGVAVLLALVLAGLVLLAVGALAGPRGVVLALAALIVSGVSGWLVRQRRASRAAWQAHVEVAHACEVLSAHLRVGQVPTEALAVAAQDCAVLERASAVHGVGGDVTAVWRVQARQPGRGGLLELARAWQVSAQTGAPLAGTLAQVAAALSAEESLRTVVSGELASPRATSKVMAALPACGIGIGYLLGGSPIQWLLAGPAGWLCVVGGVVLAGIGVIWIELLARQASTAG